MVGLAEERNAARFRRCSLVQIPPDNADGPHLPSCAGEDNKFSVQSYLQAVILTSHPCFGQTAAALDLPNAGCNSH